MSITPAFALEIFTAHGTGHMLGASDLMDEMGFLVREVLIALLAVVVLGSLCFVLLHLLYRFEEEATVFEGARHASVWVRVLVCHLGFVCFGR